MADADADLRQRLEDLRDDLHGRMKGASDRDYAALASRYQSVLTEIAELPDPNAAADKVEMAQADETVLRLVR